MSTSADLGVDPRRTLAPKTAKHYASLYDVHIAPHLGQHKLAELTGEMPARGRPSGSRPGGAAVLQALMLLGCILQRAMEGERIARNSARLVRKFKRSPRREVRPVAP